MWRVIEVKACGCVMQSTLERIRVQPCREHEDRVAKAEVPCAVCGIEHPLPIHYDAGLA